MVIYFPGGSRVWSAYAATRAISRVQANGIDNAGTSRYNRAKHDGLVGLVLEVRLPELVELRTHFLELSFGWADLMGNVNEGTCLTQE